MRPGGRREAPPEDRFGFFDGLELGHRDHRILLMRVGLGQQDVEPMRVVPGLDLVNDDKVQSRPKVNSGSISGYHRVARQRTRLVIDNPL